MSALGVSMHPHAGLKDGCASPCAGRAEQATGSRAVEVDEH